MNIVKWKGLDIDPMKISESLTTKPSIGQIDTAFNESTNEAGITVLYPRIEAIHAGRTRNFNRYEAEKLKGSAELRSGVYSWTAPYAKPIIFNHDINTECVGRVYSASYSDVTQAGRPGIVVTPKITDKKTIEDVLEGRLLTVSIGATTNAAVCSCCGTDIINEGWCGHMRGEEYDGQVCEWVCGDLFFDELSWVNVPADSDAMVTASGINQQQMLTSEQVVVKTVVEKTNTTKEDDNLTKENKVVEATTVEEQTTETEVQEETTVVEETQVEESTEQEETTVEETSTEDVQVEEVETEEAETEEAKTEIEATTTEESTDEDEVATLEESLATANAKITELEESLAEETRLKEELQAANLQLAKDLHESTVDFLVELRAAIGKESDKEEAKTRFAERTLDSLRDAIADILVEKPTLHKGRTVETVVKPTGKSISESTSVTTATSKVISNEEVLKNLLLGRK